MEEIQNTEQNIPQKSSIYPNRNLVFIICSLGNISEEVKKYKDLNAKGLLIRGPSFTEKESKEIGIPNSTSLKEIALKFSDAEEIVIQSGFFNDWEELKNFKNLKILIIRSEIINKKEKELYFPKLDLNWFEYLEFFETNSLKYVKNLQNSKIKDLRISNCPELKSGLNNIKFPNTLESLCLFDSKINSLNGIAALNLKKINLRNLPVNSISGVENLEKLEEISLISCRKLEGIEQLDKLKCLKSLVIAGCKKIDFERFTKNSNLKRIIIDAIEIKSSIPSLKFLLNFPNLEECQIMGTKVFQDGDLTPLLNLSQLKTIWFSDSKSYSHKLKEIYLLKKLKLPSYLE